MTITRTYGASMTFHDLAPEDEDVIVMFHPLGVFWDIFDLVTPILTKKYRVVMPAVPGMDPDRPDATFTSVEQIAAETAAWLADHGIARVKCLYGCSMGGGIVAYLLAHHLVEADCAVMDGGMTPYRLPKPITWLIALRDFAMIEIGKHAGMKVLRSLFDPEKYTDEDLQYVRRCMNLMSARTILRSFYSANNYSMPRYFRVNCPAVEYWYGEEEKKERAWDLKYIRYAFPAARIVENPGLSHAEYFSLHPEAFCAQLEQVIQNAE